MHRVSLSHRVGAVRPLNGSRFAVSLSGVPPAAVTIAALHTQTRQYARSLLASNNGQTMPSVDAIFTCARFSTASASEAAPATATATASVGATPIPMPTNINHAHTNVPPHLPPPRFVNRPTPASSMPASSGIPFLRPPSQLLLDIEAFALTESDPEKKVSLEAYKTQFNYVLQKGLPIAELLRVFRSWVSHMPNPPELTYIHSYIDARVRKGHSINAILVDLSPFINQFTDQTLVLVMLLCAKQRSTEETVNALRFIATQVSHRIPLTLSLMNRFIKNFSMQNDISGATILYDELASYNLVPDQETFESMYLGFARMKEMEAAFSVFGHMQQRGIPLKIGMFEEVIEVCVRYDNAEAGLLTLQRIASFNQTQPKVNDGQETTLILTPRCFELLIRAYLNKQQLDLVMQIYYELRRGDLVLSSLTDFNLLLELVAKNISFQDALQVMADRIQASEKQAAQIKQIEEQIAAPTTDEATKDAARRALASIQPMPPPHISSFNILLRIAGHVERNLSNIQLILSELQRIGCAMSTDTFNILIKSYANLKELQGMSYIYGEFKQAALNQEAERRNRIAQDAIAQKAATATDGNANTNTSVVPTSGVDAPNLVDSSIVHPDVQTYNIMLGQIDPRTFLADLHTSNADKKSELVSEPPSIDEDSSPPSSSSSSSSTILTASESASLQMVESLLADMRIFQLLPDELTFKLILKIMSNVGSSHHPIDASAASTPPDSTTSLAASAAVSPHVVHFFNMLMDLVVAHQARVTATAPAAAGDVKSTDGASAVSTVSFESGWYSFLDFLYRSSNSSNRSTNFHYILLCLRRLKKDGCAIPKNVVRSLIVNHLGGTQRKSLQHQHKIGNNNSTHAAAAAGPIDATHITEVNWLQAIHFLKEFSPVDQSVDEDVLTDIFKSASTIEQAAAAAATSSSAAADRSAQPTLTWIVLDHLQRTLVWDQEVDTSRLTEESIVILKQFGVDHTPSQTSLLIRDRTHFAIFMACVHVHRYDLAIEVITNMQEHQRHLQQKHAADVAAQLIPAYAPMPILYVDRQLGALFKALLDGVRRYALTSVKPLDWSALRRLFEMCEKWKFTPTTEHYRVLIDEAMRFRSASLARYAFESAVTSARYLATTSVGYRFDQRFYSDVLTVVFTPPEVQWSTRATRGNSIELAATYVDQVDFLQTVLTRMIATHQMPLPYDVVLKILTVAEQLESTEMAAVIYKYLVGTRKAPDARLYAPLIHLCRFQNAYPLAIELYRAVQLADRVPFECQIAVLQLHAFAPKTPHKSSMVWSIFTDMVRMVPRNAAPLHANAAQTLVQALMQAIEAHAPQQQVTEDLPKIESIIRVLMELDTNPSVTTLNAESSQPITVTPETKQRDHELLQSILPLKSILPRLPLSVGDGLLKSIATSRDSLSQLIASQPAMAEAEPTPTKTLAATPAKPTKLAQMLSNIAPEPTQPTRTETKAEQTVTETTAEPTPTPIPIPVPVPTPAVVTPAAPRAPIPVTTPLLYFFFFGADNRKPTLLEVYNLFSTFHPVVRVRLSSKHAVLEFGSVDDAVSAHSQALLDPYLKDRFNHSFEIEGSRSTTIPWDAKKLTPMIVRDFRHQPVMKEELEQLATINETNANEQTTTPTQTSTQPPAPVLHLLQLDLSDLPRQPTLTELYYLCQPTGAANDAIESITVLTPDHDADGRSSPNLTALVRFTSRASMSAAHGWLGQLARKRGATINSSIDAPEYMLQGEVARERNFKEQPIDESISELPSAQTTEVKAEPIKETVEATPTPTIAAPAVTKVEESSETAEKVKSTRVLPISNPVLTLGLPVPFWNIPILTLYRLLSPIKPVARIRVLTGHQNNKVLVEFETYHDALAVSDYISTHRSEFPEGLTVEGATHRKLKRPTQSIRTHWRDFKTQPITQEEANTIGITPLPTPLASPTSSSTPVPPASVSIDTPVESVRVVSDTFLAWNALSVKAASIQSADELSQLLSQPTTSRMVRNMIEHQGFVVGLKLLANQANLQASNNNIQTIAYNKSTMLRLLFRYCLFNRNTTLFHQLCSQLQSAGMLPRPIAFKNLSNEVLTKWATLHVDANGEGPKVTVTNVAEADVVASDVNASLIDGDDWTNVPTPISNTSNAEEDLIYFLRATVQWMCTAHGLPTQVWLSGMRINTPNAQADAALNAGLWDAPKLAASAIQIGFNAQSLQKRLEYWMRNGIPLSVERVLNVYAFKTVCALAIGGNYQPLASFMQKITKSPNLGISTPAVYKSSIQWLAHHEFHQQANEVWTNMMIRYIPQLKHHVRPTGEVADTIAIDTVRSLCNSLLTAYVLRYEDDTMLFRIYATMRSLNLPPPKELLGIIPLDLVDTLTPAHQLLYIMIHRVMVIQGHIKFEYMMKLFGEVIKVPTHAPIRFTIRDAPTNTPAAKSSATEGEWPIIPGFLDAIAARIVPEYIRPSWPQKLARPEFADQIKKLIHHLDSDDALSFTTPILDPTKQVKRDRLWNLFIELQSKGVVFNVPLLHHLAQSLATKDAIVLATVTRQAEEEEEEEGESIHSDILTTIPIPTVVQQLWKLILHHGEFDQNTLAYLIMAQFRHYRAAQQKRGLTLRTIRSLDYYRHILYGTPYVHPPVPRSSSLTTFADVASSGFSSQVALQWLGLDKLDQPLPNMVHMTFEQMERDWRHILEEDAARQPIPGEEDVETTFDEDVELPLNATSYNYILQSCLLFTDDSMPIRWAQIHSIRSLMSERRFMLNSTSVLYLLDTLIEAREFQDARAILPPPSATTPTKEKDLNMRLARMERVIEEANRAKEEKEARATKEKKVEGQQETNDKPAEEPSTSAASAPASTSASSAPSADSASSSSLWSRIRGWFLGSDEQAALDRTPAIATPADVAAAAIDPLAANTKQDEEPTATPAAPTEPITPPAAKEVNTAEATENQPTVSATTATAAVTATPAVNDDKPNNKSKRSQFSGIQSANNQKKNANNTPTPSSTNKQNVTKAPSQPNQKQQHPKNGKQTKSSNAKSQKSS